MLNLLGDIWPRDGIPRWDEVMQHGSAKLHLYGKTEARPGRKMGHINCLAGDTTEARQLLAEIKYKLGSKQGF
jgi:5-(carboxyamino)imidazole ribonucleotide synthase